MDVDVAIGMQVPSGCSYFLWHPHSLCSSSILLCLRPLVRLSSCVISSQLGTQTSLCKRVLCLSECRSLLVRLWLVPLLVSSLSLRGLPLSCPSCVLFGLMLRGTLGVFVQLWGIFALLAVLSEVRSKTKDPRMKG